MTTANENSPGKSEGAITSPPATGSVSAFNRRVTWQRWAMMLLLFIIPNDMSWPMLTFRAIGCVMIFYGFRKIK